MKVSPFTPLFQPVTQISKVKFQKSDIGAGPEMPVRTKKYIVQMSKLLVCDYLVEASSAGEAERKALEVIHKNPALLESISRVEGWEVDDVIDNLGTRVKPKVPHFSPF